MSMRVNLTQNPNFESGVPIGTNSNFSASTQSSTQKHSGTYAAKATTTATAVNLLIDLLGTNAASTPTGSFAQGDFANASIWLYTTNTGTWGLGVAVVNSLGADTGEYFQSYVTSVAANTWTRLVTPIPTITSATASALRFFVFWYGGTAPIGTDVYLDDMLIEKSNATVPGTYFDGNTAGAAWTGTANLSTSQIAAAGSSALPVGLKVEIEFKAGTWTDVTQYVKSTDGISLRAGRTSEFAQPQVGTCSLTLDNRTGNFTPLNAAGAYYSTAAVVYGNQGKQRVRVSYNSGATMRFFGTIKSWTPGVIGGAYPVAHIEAIDSLNTAGQKTLTGTLLDNDMRVAAQNNAQPFWPLTDATGTASFADSGYTLAKRPLYTSPAITVAQSNGVPYDLEKSAYVSCPMTSASPGALSSSGLGAYPSYQVSSPTWIEMWVNFPSNDDGYNWALQVQDSVGTYVILSSGVVGSTVAIGASAGSSVAIPLNSWHHVAIKTSNPQAFYIDGVAKVTTPGTFAWSGNVDVTIGKRIAFGSATNNLLASRIGFDTVASAADVLRHYQMGVGTFTELSGARVSRYLSFAGTSGTVDTGAEVIGPHTIDGKSLLSAIDDIVTTESGGAAFYTNPAGSFRYIDRNYRTTTTPVMTIDASIDISPDQWLPLYDSIAQITDSTVTGPYGSYEYAITGTATETVTIYSADPLAPKRVAEYRVNSTQPAPRFQQLAVNIARCSNAAALYAALANIAIGSRLRISTIPKLLTLADGSTTRVFHVDTIDAYVEGWSEQVSDDNYLVTFDLSPADNPVRAVWDTSRWASTSVDTTLNATLTSAATSVSVLWAYAPFSTTPGDYPLNIQIDQEIMTITTAPASAADPQTLTVTRGQAGTFADAHNNVGAGITVSPYAAWAL